MTGFISLQSGGAGHVLLVIVAVVLISTVYGFAAALAGHVPASIILATGLAFIIFYTFSSKFRESIKSRLKKLRN